MPALPDNWYVDVVIEDPPGVCSGYSIGAASWSHARELAAKWEREYGENTAHVRSRKADYERHAIVGYPGRAPGVSTR